MVVYGNICYRFKSWFQLPPKGDNVNINVFKYGDFLVACTDSPVFQTVTQDLNTVGSVSMVWIYYGYIMDIIVWV